MTAPRRPCQGCALTDGACANREPHNHLAALICLRAGLPFYCHDTALADWKDPIAFKVAIFKRQPMPICQGWARDVRRLAAKGYFRVPTGVTQLRHELGRFALRALERFTAKHADEDPYAKQHAREDLHTAVEILFAEAETPSSLELVELEAAL